ncbi:uncharacterized protein RCC_10008 [Ramularia collo-cygni]|uniref:Uncharacterized protein n=1 Tax=Ramularia collo-cygni TaxID=112498 RepID=A0A2D3V1U2_9PEZI|nr:uncharacterized protein RCC_10008 [Ramularia collo-cygni]CZT24287.1 uncharacterized protein RCC_10008 [Ramularia collo-cygni]
MNSAEVDRLVRQLALGFETLQDEYQKLHGQHEALARKLVTAREQYNELSKLYGTEQTSTPPLSLSSALGHQKDESIVPSTTSVILEQRESTEAASKISAAKAAAIALKQTLDVSQHGVRIWSGPAADRPGKEGSSSMMPSISESPLEQDFTVEGRPSQLGCPFASMSRKKLGSHAASVLSRYNHAGSIGASTPPSVPSRVNGMDSLSRRRSRRESMIDPIKAEICGLSDHDEVPPRSVKAISKAASVKIPPVENADAGVCPIRFLDQHSPEEVATYFEKHKHELPRSHEDCVMRYQGGDQVKELDAKYDSIVAMIQGLGQKHKDYLPEEPEEDEEDDASHLSVEKVRKWASSVSAQAPAGDEADDENGEERRSHFERDLRDIRVGESPSRPWGIQVPLQYLEVQSNASSKPVQVSSPGPIETLPKDSDIPEQMKERPAGKCPFGHGGPGATKPLAGTTTDASHIDAALPSPPERAAADSKSNQEAHPEGKATIFRKEHGSQMVFNGPVFIGYSVEDAVRILKDSGLKTT